MRMLLPFETLDDAALLFNEFCREHHFTGNYGVKHFLALAIFGDIHLTVKLPEEFRFRGKHEYGKAAIFRDDQPLGWRFPKGALHFYISRGTAFKLSDESFASLDSVHSILDDGTKIDYSSVTPFMNISVSDLRINNMEFSGYVNKFLAQQIASKTTDANEKSLPVAGSTADSSADARARSLESEASSPSILANVTFESLKTTGQPSVPENGAKQGKVEKQIPRLRAQENAILSWLVVNNFTPQALPASPNGHSTPKAAANAALNGTGLFTAPTAFKRAWERLKSTEAVRVVK